MDDHLIKLNYFLLDVRGRNPRSYMKAPIPDTDDPTHDRVVKALVKNGIDVAEYRSSYEASTIPPNNILSQLAMDIFKSTASMVSDYSKYPDQLKHIIDYRLDCKHIEKSNSGKLIVIDHNAFANVFQDIINLTSETKQRSARKQSQSTTNATNIQNGINSQSQHRIGERSVTSQRLSLNCENSLKEIDIFDPRSQERTNDLVLIDSTSKNISTCFLL